MFTKRDQQFLELLDDPVKLEKRLVDLAGVRKVTTFAAGFSGVAFFVCVFLGMQQVPFSISPGAALMLLLVIQQAISACLAHGELRTLLTFRALRAANESS